MTRRHSRPTNPHRAEIPQPAAPARAHADGATGDTGRHVRAIAAARYRERKRVDDGGELEAWLDAERADDTF